VLLEEAEAGFLSFERFMQVALYHSEHGYYAKYAQDVGKRGDFSTAATLHPVLGKAIARWALAQGGVCQWIEVGAGNGDLARTILRDIGWWRRRRRCYRIVEVSPALRALQQERLKGYPVTWHDTVRDALDASGGEALVFSNELVDAFPCVRLEWNGEQWKELGLRITVESSAEALREPQARVRPYLPEPWAGIRKGQRCEVHVAYREWLAEWLPALRWGHLLTIDYGGEDVCRRWPRGTMRAYFRQESYDGGEVYQRVGRQDLTADVNFSDLRRWGEELGMKERAFLTQREFVLGQLPGLKVGNDPALAFLLDEEGAGGAFRVLWQACGGSTTRIAPPHRP